MWSWLQPLSRVSECFSVESAFWMDSANHRSPTISKPSWQSCGLCVHIEARTVFLPPMSHCWSRPPSIFLASSVKQSHNERTSTVFHWSHKCTKMRLRRVTSLDSPGQTGRVLHCVGQRSCEKKKKKKSTHAATNDFDNSTNCEGYLVCIATALKDWDLHAGSDLQKRKTGQKRPIYVFFFLDLKNFQPDFFLRSWVRAEMSHSFEKKKEKVLFQECWCFRTTALLYKGQPLSICIFNLEKSYHEAIHICSIQLV